MSIRANKAGIQLEKPAIKALLAFAGESEKFDHVHFRVAEQGANLIVNATDGHRALECVSTTEDPHCVVGEWAVARDFLSACYRALEAGQSCLLRVKKGGLRTASLLKTGSLEEAGAITWADEAASTQITMAQISDVLRIAQAARHHTGSWYAVQGRYLADLKLVTQACGKLGAVTVYPPQSPIDPVGFEAKGDGVRWSGVVMPVRVEGPGESVADEDDADPPENDGDGEDRDDEDPDNDAKDGEEAAAQ
jgi:hypothetical protein